MASYRKTEILSGLFILLALLVFMLFAFKVGRFDFFGLASPDKRILETLLSETATLEPGAKVCIGGFRVGTVDGIRLASREEIDSFMEALDPAVAASAYPDPAAARVLVSFHVEAGHFRKGQRLSLSANESRVLLQQDGFLGTHYLQLDPGSASGPSLFESERDQPLRLPSEDRGLMASVMRELEPTLARVNRLLDKIGDGLLSEANLAQVEAMLPSINRVLDKADRGMEEILILLGDSPRGLRSMILDPASSLVAEMEGTVREAREELNASLYPRARTLLDRGADAANEATATFSRAGSLIDENRAKIDAILSQIEKATDGLRERLDRTEATIQDVGDRLAELLANSNSTLSENRAEIAEIMRSIRRMSWELEIFSRKIRSNPGVFLWGDKEVPLEALPVDAERSRRTGRAAPFDQREENRGR